MKKLVIFVIVAVFLVTGTAIAEHKAGWSPKCTADTIRYCNKQYKYDSHFYKGCLLVERACGEELFDTVYPKDATEDELWECKRKLIKLMKDNGILSSFMALERGYCDLLKIVKEQWENK